MPRQVSVTRTIPAPPEQIFELLSDPAKHPLLDGSDTVRAARDGSPQRLRLGSTFGMDMKLGVPYRIKNTVVEFEPDRLIAWSHPGGHRWRWRLRPVSDDSTEVTETFDWSHARIPFLIDLSPFPRRNRQAMQRSLDRLAALLATS